MAWLIALLSALLTVSLLLATAGASSPPVGGPCTTITLIQGAWGAYE
jgi:hypothetical protein